MKFSKLVIRTHITQSNIYDEDFCENNYWFSTTKQKIFDWKILKLFLKFYSVNFVLELLCFITIICRISFIIIPVTVFLDYD